MSKYPNFNNTIEEVMEKIASKFVELIGIDCGGDEKHLLWNYTVDFKSSTITGESFYGRGSVCVPLNTIEYICGVSVDIDVDEYGGASYADLTTEIKFHRVKNSDQLLFNRLRIRR